MDKHYGYMQNGRLKAGTLNAAVRMYPEGTQLEFTVRKSAARRTSPQNRYFHGVVLAVATKAIRDLGTMVTPEEVKEYWKRAFAPIDVPTSAHGEFIVLGKKTSEMEVDEFVAFTDRCVAWCAEQGIIIPSPGEQQSMELAA